MTDHPYRELVHAPADLALEYVQWAKSLRGARQVPFGIPVVDAKVVPFHPGDMVVFCARPGHAKCLGKGTPVLMFDGTTRLVEDIKVGDWLIGPDSQSRRVISTISGRDEMYRIIPVKGMSYIVNQEHILSLKMSGTDYGDGKVVNIGVNEYCKKSARWRHHAKGYRASVEWQPWPVPLFSYYLGLWLGDGTAGTPNITTKDPEIVAYLGRYAKSLNMRLHIIVSADRCPTYCIVDRKGKPNPITVALRRLGICNVKDHIPRQYLINSRDVRLQVLAGLIDSDGTYHRYNLSITQKSKSLADDIAFLARSLGFAAYVKEMRCRCSNTGVWGTYHRIHISGELSTIPTQIKRKQMPKRKQKKDVLRTGITVERIGQDKYYGFELDGVDGLFLLGDFTVTHNTSMLAYLARAEAKRIVERGEGDRVVVYVTFEQVAEEIEAVFQCNDTYTASDLVWGRVAIEDVERNAIHRASLPIFIIGNSLTRTGAGSPRMYPEIVFQAIESLEGDYGVKPSLILVDYIQLIPIPHQADRHKQVIEAAYRVKEIAQRVGCPAAVAVQARREVDSRDVKIPGLWDAQWSSAIEQTADKFFSLWRPWLTEAHRDEYDQLATITIDQDTYPVSKKLLVMRMLKQRFEDGRYTWGLHFDPRYLKLCAIEKDVEEPFGGDRW